MKYRNIVSIIIIAIALSGCATMQTNSIKRAQNQGIPIVVTKIYPSFPNSAGGVDAHVNFVNTSRKTFKYVVFEVIPYNRVGDVAPSEIGYKSTARLQATGPHKPMTSFFESVYKSALDMDGYWENVWYNSTIRCIEVHSVEITYMDGSTECFSGAEVSKVIAEGVKNSCSVQ